MKLNHLQSLSRTLCSLSSLPFSTPTIDGGDNRRQQRCGSSFSNVHRRRGGHRQSTTSGGKKNLLVRDRPIDDLIMAKRRGRNPVKKNASIVDDAVQDEDVLDKNEDASNDQEVERQVTAIRALRDVETEQLVTMLHLLRSSFQKEQLQVPVTQFFKENLPNLSVKKDELDSKYEVHWKDVDGSLYMEQADDENIHTSLLHRLSMVYQDFPNAMPSLCGFEFSNRSVKTSMFGVDTLQIGGFDLGEPSNTHMFERQDKFQTPGVADQRLSIGMTPKTLRIPKPGEMLLSVHGSPLGVYKEDNMEAINEMEDGSD